MPGGRKARIVWAAAAALVLGACTGQGNGDDEPDAADELDAYLDTIFPTGPGQPNPAAVQWEEIVAECMAEAGFEYYPDRTAGMGGSQAIGMEGPFEDAEVYGYGMSLEGPDGSVPQFWGGSQGLSEAQERNAAYRAALSAEAQVQYSLAMDGDWSEYSDVYDQVISGDLVYNPARAGCTGRASIEAYPDGMAGPAELEDVKEAVRTMWERLPADPGVVETLPAWSACMADAGYPAMREIIDATDYVSTELWTRWQDSYANATPGNVGVTDYEVVKESIPEALHELQEAERALAVADAACRAESGYAEAYEVAEVAIAQEILDTYRADLDTWVAWAEAQQAE